MRASLRDDGFGKKRKKSIFYSVGLFLKPGGFSDIRAKTGWFLFYSIFLWNLIKIQDNCSFFWLQFQKKIVREESLLDLFQIRDRFSFQ